MYRVVALDGHVYIQHIQLIIHSVIYKCIKYEMKPCIASVALNDRLLIRMTIL
jgi:hypothetical protein